MTHDFGGYATRANVRCSDGRTILPDAFKESDGGKVPLVWQHGHKSATNVLGHAMLENREDGVYAYGFFNESDAAKSARIAVEHGDIDALSIYASDLVQRKNDVVHGSIREVSLCLTGANPEARIDNVVLAHAYGDDEELDSEAVITSDAHLEHAEGDDKEDDGDDDSSERTVKDVLETYNEEQLNVLEYLLDKQAEETPTGDNTVQHSNLNEGEPMSFNVFESGTNTENTLSHAQRTAAVKEINGILAHAAANHESFGSMKEALKQGIANSKELKHAIGEDTEYGINNLELLFPDAQGADKPEAIRRQQEWVSAVLSGVSKRPFSRIKMMNFNMTHEEARARGYIRSTLKKESYFSITGRETAPTTVYQKQKIDRDDIIDITTVDIVAWMLAEMRISLNEEIARAILVGDNREVDDPDKIREDKIRPIVKDDDFYAHKVNVPASIWEDGLVLVDTIFKVRKAYKGTGSPKLYTSEGLITDLLLLRDKDDRRHYDSKEALARALNVSAIVEVDDAMFYDTDLLGVIVNLADYAVGTDKGGEISSFDDFDIDFNQYKYLLEGRMSGSLTKPKSAVVLRKSSGTELTESSPLVDPAPTHEPTVPVGGTYRSTGPKGGQVRQDEDPEVEP